MPGDGVFLHAWNDNSEDTKAMLEVLKPLSFKVESQIDFKYIPTGQTTKFNLYSKYYSLQKSIELAYDYGDYDLILSTRFDTVFFKPIDYSVLESDNFYVSDCSYSRTEPPLLPDNWFIAGRDISTLLGQTYDRLDGWFADGKYLAWIKSHRLGEENLYNGHLIWAYRLHELGLEDRLRHVCQE